jgi:putative acetyltransferase
VADAAGSFVENAPLPIAIRPADFANQALQDLIALHVGQARANTPAGFSFALAADGLRRADIALFTAHDGPALIGMGALKALSLMHGELKSMRTAPGHLRKGVAAAMLHHLIAEARARGMTRLSLETGTTSDYAPAIALYLKFGFAPGDVFADYAPSPHNQCFHLGLA